MATPDVAATVHHLHAAALMHKQLRGAALQAHEERLLREHRDQVRQQALRAGETPS